MPSVVVFASTVLLWGAVGDPDAAHHLLQERIGVSTSELATLDRGRVVAKSLKVDDRRELAAAGAVKVAVPAEFLLSRFNDIVTFKVSTIVRQIGKFSDPPGIGDLRGLTFDSADVEALRKCRVGDCGIQLSAEQIQRVNATIDWSTSDARDRANALLREVLLEYVHAYREAGNSALIEYRDAKEPLRVSDEVRALVQHSSLLLSDVPELGDYLIGSSATPPPDAEQFIYWSKEQFGLKPVVSITHVVVYRPKRAHVADFVTASKQIYASRYLRGSLALTLGIVPAPSIDSPSFYMIYTNRTRPVAFPPVIGGIVRLMAQSQGRSGLEENLRLTRDKLEAAYAASR